MVDPDDCEDLRDYIRGQWERHESGTLVARLEAPGFGPQGLPVEVIGAEE